MKKRFFRAVIFSALVFSSLFYAGENGVFENMRNIFSQAENFQVSFESLSGKVKGKAFFSKKYGEKIEFGDYVIIVKNDTVFNYNSKINRLLISLREDEYANFSLKTVLFDLPARCRVTEENNIVKLIAHEPEEENFSEIEIYPNESNLPQKIVITDLYGNKNAFVLSEYKFNINVTPDNFEISTDKRTKIVDLR